MPMEDKNFSALEKCFDDTNEVVANRWFPFKTPSLPKWVPTSNSKLQSAEARMLSVTVQCPMERGYVKLRSGNQIWTVITNKNASDATPLVMVHGFGGGTALWALNVDALSSKRTVYTFDMLGFGQSSRPKFSAKRCREAEEKFVESIEEWREALNIERMILLGHSFGGYICCCYALKYPDRLKSLILADPWGFESFDPDSDKMRRIPCWIRWTLRTLMRCNCSPFAIVRAAGPCGPRLVRKFRPDFKQRFRVITDKDKHATLEYIYHCNAGRPSGERGFRAMTVYMAFPADPMIDRIGELRPDVPVTFIYGANSWVDIESGYHAQQILTDNAVDVYTVKGSAHHVYADSPDSFNEIVTDTCDAADPPAPRDVTDDVTQQLLQQRRRDDMTRCMTQLESSV